MKRRLRKAITALPLGEIDRLRRDGVRGKPLHRALGFRRPGDVNVWLAGGEVAEEDHT